MHGPSQISCPLFCFCFFLFSFFVFVFSLGEVFSGHPGKLARNLKISCRYLEASCISSITYLFKCGNKALPHRTYSDILHDCWCFVLISKLVQKP